MNAWHDDGLDADFNTFLDEALPADFSAHAGDGAGYNPYDLHDDPLGDGPLPHLQRADPQRVGALVHAASGVRFDALVVYAEPLLRRYDYDVQEALALSVIADQVDAEKLGTGLDHEEADETLVTLLETARLLWAFFSLSEADRDAHRTTLLTHCYGPDADAEAWEEFADLLEAMETAWQSLTAALRASAEATDTLGFEALLDTTADSAFDPGRECDARALFALPLLDDPNVQADPARFEAALHRADAYWTLAQQPDRAGRLDALLPTLAEAPTDLMALRAEAEQMLARYDVLFRT
ncbi:MAG: hypothetical protein AAF624_17445 [Bacteroidota bacterium]